MSRNKLTDGQNLRLCAPESALGAVLEQPVDGLSKVDHAAEVLVRHRRIKGAVQGGGLVCVLAEHQLLRPFGDTEDVLGDLEVRVAGTARDVQRGIAVEVYGKPALLRVELGAVVSKRDQHLDLSRLALGPRV